MKMKPRDGVPRKPVARMSKPDPVGRTFQSARHKTNGRAELLSLQAGRALATSAAAVSSGLAAGNAERCLFLRATPKAD